MAVTSKSMELRNVIDAYAIGVRAGVITPCIQDENAFRRLLGLDAAPQEVVDNWKMTDGIRQPNTIRRSVDELAEIGDATEQTGEQDEE